MRKIQGPAHSQIYPASRRLVPSGGSLNNNGAALIIALLVMYALVTLSAGLALSSVQEIHNSRRYRDSTSAFWLAEAALNRYKKNPSILDKENSVTLYYGDDWVKLTRDESEVGNRLIKAIGNVRGSQRTIQLTYPANVPEVFKNAVSVQGDISIGGGKTSVLLGNKTRLSGKVNRKARQDVVFFEDLKQGQPKESVSLAYPDANNDGKSDQFDDFVQFNRDLMSRYPKDQVLYLQGNGTNIISSAKDLKGKKIIYYEGKEAGGDVKILLNEPFLDQQNVTVISTGTITLTSAQMGDQSQLNLIAWTGYQESTITPVSFKGVIFTHGVADFREVHDTSLTRGNVIANGGLRLQEIWSNKVFRYEDTTRNGVIPPGFEGLISGGQSSGYVSKPSLWQEIHP